MGSTGSDIAYSVAIDSNNNVYITGYTYGSLYGTNAGNVDAFLVKYDSTGIKVWTRQLGTTGEDIAYRVAIDSNNNVYITGYTQGSLHGSNAGSFDAFLAKYDSTGTKVWTRQLGSTAADFANSVAIDSNNNVYITGSTAGSLDGTNAGDRDAFLAKYVDPSPPPAPSPPVPICFPKGTPVTTNQGLVAIEKLNTDIHTIRGKKIVAITQTRPLFKHIVSIEKDALGKNVPSATTQISNEHRVFY